MIQLTYTNEYMSGGEVGEVRVRPIVREVMAVRSTRPGTGARHGCTGRFGRGG